MKRTVKLSAWEIVFLGEMMRHKATSLAHDDFSAFAASVRALSALLSDATAITVMATKL